MAKVLTGTVTSDKMQQTLVVRVDSVFSHPTYKKVVKQSKKYKVHVGDNAKYIIGDVVTIQETKPVSKTKHFIVVSKVTK